MEEHIVFLSVKNKLKDTHITENCILVNIHPLTISVIRLDGNGTCRFFKFGTVQRLNTNTKKKHFLI